MNYAFYVIPLLLIISIPTAFAQTATSATSVTGTSATGTSETELEPFVFTNQPYTKPNNLTSEGVGFYEVRNPDGTFTLTSHYPYFETESGELLPYRLNEDSSMIQVEVNGGKIVFDKTNGSVTIFDEDEIIVSSDSYVVKSALEGTDVWNNLSTNDEPVSVTVLEQGESLLIVFAKENELGTFQVEYTIYAGKLKTDLFFINKTLDNNKISFTETMHIPKLVTINEQEYDLSTMNGMSFDRSTLEQNEDLVLEAKEILFNAGLGFEYLWQVNIIESIDSENVKISLDYANSDRVWKIGETVWLDPTWNITGTINGSNVDFNISTLNNASVNSGDIDGTALTSSQITSLQNALNSGTTTWSQPFSGGHGFQQGVNHSWGSNTGVGLNLNNGTVDYIGGSGGQCWESTNTSTNNMYVSYTIPSATNIGMSIQLTDNNTGSYPNWVRYFIIYLYEGGTVHSAAYKPYIVTNLGSTVIGDTWSVEINNGQYQFKKNGTVLQSGTEIGTNFNGMICADSSNSGSGGAWASSFGSAPPVLNINYSTATVPTAPQNLLVQFNSPNVDLQFTAPSSDGGSAITGYKIEHSTDGNNYSVLVNDTGNTNTTYSHTNPTLGQTNYYKVYAINGIGLSVASNVDSILAGVPPNPPTNLTSSIQDVNTNPLNVVLNWTSPTNVGTGTLSGFEVWRNGSLVTTTGLVNTYTDTVTDGTHSYYLKSVSTHGTSIASNTTNITTPTIPSAITDLSGNVISDTQISLSWTAPSDGGSNIDLYKIFKDGTQIDTTTNLNYSATGLTANTAYTFLVVANNSVGDSANSNSVNLTTYQSVSGSITVTTNTQGATTEFTFVPNNISGTPTPNFNTFTLMEGVNEIASGISSPYYLAHSDASSKTYSITSTDNSHWDSPTITGTITAQSDYAPNWNTQNVSYNYTRNSGVMDLTVNKDSQNTWDANCSYKTTTEVIDGDPGISSTHNGIWFISESQNINDADTVYVSCVDGSDQLFTFTSFGPNRLAGGIAQLDNVFGEWTGTPVALIFVLLVAGLFTGRSAPTGILLVLALIGVLGFIGMLTIDEAVWGFLLLAGVLGIFIGKRFL